MEAVMTLTSEQQALRDSFRQVLGDVAAPSDTRRACDSGADPAARLWAQMAELGWLALPIAAQFGGLGLGRVETAALYEELGRCVAPAPVLGVFLAAEALSVSGDDGAKQRWLPGLARGEAKIAVAADFSASVAERGGRVTGRVAHMLDVGADAMIAPIESPPASPRLALVKASAPGVSAVLTPAIDITRALGAIEFKDGEAEIIALTPAQWSALQDHAHIALACDSLGGAEAILDRTVAYMQTREQFGRPIGSFQALKHRAAQWKVLLEAARALVQSAVAKWEAGDPALAIAASAAKFYACDAYAAIAGDAVQLHGGIGFTWEHECHLYLKRAKLNQTLFGASAAHKDRIAALRFGHGRST